MASTSAFIREYLRPRRGAVEAREVEYDRGGERLPATLYRPARAAGRLPGWVVLHGLTWHGRAHPSLVRFARAIAASGAIVLVPEIPEWRQLRVAPAITVPTIRAAILALDALEESAPGRTGLLGFSFGATQGLIASVDPLLDGHLAAVAAWGGYADLHRLFHFGLTGEHEWEGVRHHLEPDRYGGWIMGANYLTCVPGHEADGAVAEALRTLAEEAGRRQVRSWLPEYDPVKRALRATLHPAQRPLFDAFAPPAGQPAPDPDAAIALAHQLAEAARRQDPLLDPAPFLARVPVDVLLAHGRDDRLVPFTETLRLGRALPPARLHGPTITSLFAHSGGRERDLGVTGLVRETTRLLGVLRGILGLV